MKRFRIGNDIYITWAVMRNGIEVDLTDKKVVLYATHAKGRDTLKGAVLSGNTISYTFDGTKQSVLGPYTLTIDVRDANDDRRILIQDKCRAFELVGRSCVEEPEETDYTVEL